MEDILRRVKAGRMARAAELREIGSALERFAAILGPPEGYALSGGAAAGAIQSLILGRPEDPPERTRLWIRPADEPDGTCFGDALEHRLEPGTAAELSKLAASIRSLDPQAADIWISGGFAVARRDCEGDGDCLSGCGFAPGTERARLDPVLAHGISRIGALLEDGGSAFLFSDSPWVRASAHERLEAAAVAAAAGDGFPPVLAAALARHSCSRAAVVRTGGAAVLCCANSGCGFARGLIERARIPAFDPQTQRQPNPNAGAYT